MLSHSAVAGMLLAPVLLSMPVDARVVVTFVDPTAFTDIGDQEQDPRLTLTEIERYLDRLGDRYLPPQVTLRIEILDISLAGRPRWPREANAVVRVMTGEADWPRFLLRYTLESDGRTSRPVEETVVDTTYLRRLEWRYDFEWQHSLVPMPYEKRMLEQWFRTRFTEPPREGAPTSAAVAVHHDGARDSPGM